MVDAKRLQANASATRDGTLPTVALRAAPLIAIRVIRAHRHPAAVRCAICFRIAPEMGVAVGEQDIAFAMLAGAAHPAIKQMSAPTAIHAHRILLRPTVLQNATCLRLAMGMGGAVEAPPFARVMTVGAE